MSNYKGVIIEESLSDKAVLSRVKIVSTKVEPITEKHKTPWLKQWTLHTVEIPEAQAKEVAEALSHAIDTTHASWYADFKTETHHYIIYPNKVFFIDRTKKAEYDAATAYGVALGIPDYQLTFSAEVKV
jgi:hypothetical protein